MTVTSALRAEFTAGLDAEADLCLRNVAQLMMGRSGCAVVSYAGNVLDAAGSAFCRLTL